jgi:hypothetical protein
MTPKKEKIDNQYWQKPTWDRWYERSDAGKWHTMRKTDEAGDEPATKWRRLLGDEQDWYSDRCIDRASSSTADAPEPIARSEAVDGKASSEVALVKMHQQFKYTLDAACMKSASFEPAAWATIVAGRPTQVIIINHACLLLVFFPFPLP